MLNLFVLTSLFQLGDLVFLVSALTEVLGTQTHIKSVTILYYTERCWDWCYIRAQYKFLCKRESKLQYGKGDNLPCVLH